MLVGGKKTPSDESHPGREQCEFFSYPRRPPPLESTGQKNFLGNPETCIRLLGPKIGAGNGDFHRGRAAYPPFYGAVGGSEAESELSIRYVPPSIFRVALFA